MIPIGTSTSPVFRTFPVSAKTCVPFEPSVPISASHSAPRVTITGTSASVLTLFSTVGFAHSPRSTERGGVWRGMPRFPSIEYISAVDSPQTNAPAPRLISRRKVSPEPRMSFPRRPSSSAWAIAVVRFCTANGYSART